MIDPEEDKPFSYASALQYIFGHFHLVDKFLRERFRDIDVQFILAEMIKKNPIALATLVKLNYEKTESERVEEVLSRIKREGAVTVMIGAKRHGKTATAVWLAYQLHKLFPDLRIWWFGYNPAIKKYYPFIEQTFSLSKIHDGFVILDEAILYMSSRSATTKEGRARMEELPTLGHRGLAVLFITQTGQDVDPAIFRQMDYVWFKPFWAWNFDERSTRIPDYLKWIIPTRKNENMVMDMNTFEIFLFKNPLPPIYNDEIGKPFSPLTKKKEQLEFISLLEKGGFSPREIEKLCRIRGFDMHDVVG